MTLQEIKTQVAKEREKQFTPSLNKREFESIDSFVNEVCKRYARECVKASLEKAAENSTVSFKLDNSLQFAERSSIKIDKNSITSDSNIVLL